MSLADLLTQTTPGPWEIYPEFSRMQIRTADGHYGIVADTIGYDWKERGEPNARLVALAPDLAKLAIDMAAFLDEFKCAYCDPVCAGECSREKALLARFAALDQRATTGGPQ